MAEPTHPSPLVRVDHRQRSLHDKITTTIMIASFAAAAAAGTFSEHGRGGRRHLWALSLNNYANEANCESLNNNSRRSNSCSSRARVSAEWLERPAANWPNVSIIRGSSK